ncbi:MAG: DNA topoisomerase VI subunit B, partial [Planctomycetes bacterium]|nr:DNA topoisomerase VI subunit B [Planctomycetota bacterium]
LLYGSKFHTLKQARGQQGIGVSAACLYGQLTAGKPAIITSRTGKGRPAHRYYQFIDTKHNRPEVIKEEVVEFRQEHGTRVEIEMEGRYQKGQRSVDDYLKQVAIANPHIAIHYRSPEGATIEFARASEDLPIQTTAIRPHPRGVELGLLIELLKSTKSHRLSGFLQSEFSRVSAKVADQICAKAKLSPRGRPKRLAREDVDRLFRAMNDETIKILAPPASCIAPIGEDLILAGLRKEVSATFYTATTRSPSVYRGNPFLVEVGLAYGMPEKGGSAGEDEEGEELEVRGRKRKGKGRGKGRGVEASPEDGATAVVAKGNGEALAAAPALPESVPEPDSRLLGREDEQVRLIRFANRVPLQYQQSACAITKGVIRVNWKAYGLGQPRGSLPVGPMVLLVHVASVWVPFTSESKEAVASYPEIEKEIRLALCECGRRLNLFVRRRARAEHEAKRRSIFENYIGELVEAVGKIARIDRERFRRDLVRIAKKKTWRAGDGDEDGATEGGDR